MKILGSILLALAFAIPAFGQGCVGTPSVITFRVQENANGQVRGVPYATVVIMKLNDDWHIEKITERRTNVFGYYRSHFGPCNSRYTFTAQTKRIPRGGFEAVRYFYYIPDGVPQTVVINRLL